jgi:hypothetical protein
MSELNARRPFKISLLSVVRRAWIAFSLTSFAMAVGSLIIDYDNPLRSDDPYLAGGIAGLFASVFASLLAMAQELGASAAKKYSIYSISLVTPVLLLLAIDAFAPPYEGQGIPSVLAAVVGMAGIAAFFMQFISESRPTILVCSIPGALYFLGYGIASAWMLSRSAG